MLLLLFKFLFDNFSFSCCFTVLFGSRVWYCVNMILLYSIYIRVINIQVDCLFFKISICLLNLNKSIFLPLVLVSSDNQGLYCSIKHSTKFGIVISFRSFRCFTKFLKKKKKKEMFRKCSCRSRIAKYQQRNEYLLLITIDINT